MYLGSLGGFGSMVLISMVMMLLLQITGNTKINITSIFGVLELIAESSIQFVAAYCLFAVLTKGLDHADPIIMVSSASYALVGLRVWWSKMARIFNTQHA